jgi:hypothetical protein
MELTVFILLGVIVLVALLTRRVAARNAAPKTADTKVAQKHEEPTE